MTTVYFVRHAEPDYSNHDDISRELTPKGTALSVIINNYAPCFGYEDFCRIKGLMPWVVRFRFENGRCIQITEYDLFNESFAEIL